MNLTDEDWNSEEAKDIAVVVAVAATIAVAALVAAAGVVAALVAAAVAATIVAVAAIVAVATLCCSINTNNKLMRFPGAYLHYRRRIKHD